MTRPVLPGAWSCTLGPLLLVLAVGCDFTPPSLLRVGTFARPGYEPLQMARRLGYYEVGQTIRLVEYSSATQTLRAFRNGSIEAATLTLDEALMLAEEEPDTRIILVLATSQGGEAILGRPGLGRLSDLRGRRVGFEGAAQGAYLLGCALDAGGLAVKELTIVSVQADLHEKAFKSGQVDAIVTHDPMRVRLLAEGAKELFSSAQTPGEAVDVLVVRREYLRQHPEQADQLLRGWFKALDYRRNNPADASRRLGERLRLSERQTQESYQLVSLQDWPENRCWFEGEPSNLRSLVERVGARMVKHQLLARPPRPETLFDSGPLNRISARP